ncbi:MAG: hypothetical protein IPL65_02610 [Lewinellaceae bacterium]|nr:hypothetical protein [Lewinellaceae bacterium]
MKNKIHILVLLVLPLLANINITKSLASQLPPCEAPPVSYLNVSNITTTSAYLDWGYYNPPGGSVTFKVDMYDVTTQTNLPSAFTPGLSYLYSGLTDGHEYIAYVSGTFCYPGGPFGDSISNSFSTPTIIIDLVLENVASNIKSHYLLIKETH